MRLQVAAVALALAACGPAPTPTEPPAEGEAATQAPPEALAAIAGELPGFAATSAASDNSTGAQGYRVEGASGGVAHSVHVMHFNEGWRVVSIRRDLAWADVPPAVRAAAAAAPNAIEPARVVENREPGADGVIYELYAAGAQSPALEVRLVDGEAAVMPPPH